MTLHGKTLIEWAAWSIHQSRLAGAWICTDSEEIRRNAIGAGLWPWPLRPPELARDDSLVIDAIRHRLALETTKWDAVALLQPTNPLRLPEDIDAAVELMLQTKCDSVVTVSSVGEIHPARMCRMWEGGRLVWYAGEDWRRRQDLEPLYIRDGGVYLTRVSQLVDGAMVGPNTHGVIVPPERSIRIDTHDDIARAGLAMAKLDMFPKAK